MRTFKTIVACFAVSLLLGAARGHAITIDQFLASPKPVRSEVVDDVQTLEVASAGAVGGKRQLTVTKTSDDYGDAVLGTGIKKILGVDTPVLAFTLGVNAGRGKVTWDSDAFPQFVSPQGLGSIDLAEDGATAFETGLVSFDYPSDAVLSLRLYDSSTEDGSKYSEVTITLDQKFSGPGVFPLVIPFDLFKSTEASTIPAPGGATFKTTTVFGPLGGVDLTKVGAIELGVAGVEADITITSLRTNGACTWFPKPDGDITDRCGVCYLDKDPNYSYEASKVFDGCGLCPSESDYLMPAGKRDDCGVCLSGKPGYTYQDPKDSCGLCPSAPNFGHAQDPCGVCFGDGSSCADCSGTPNGSKKVDQCGVCAGDGTSCLDCLGVPNGTAGLDQCGVCAGDGTSCLDCLGVPNGTAVLDQCGVCAGGGTSCLDCLGVVNGTAVVDQCGVCAGDGTSCLDCLGVVNGTAVADQCGVCAGDGKSCLDCAGTPFGNKVVDACGDCGGNVAALQSCPKPVQCVIVQATAKVKKFERGLVRKARALRGRFLDEKKRAERMQCALDTTSAETAVSDAYEHITARGKEIFAKGVEVCGDSCVTVSYAEDVEALLPYFKTIEKEAKFLARRVKKCYSRLGVVRSAGGTNGVAQTVGTVNKDLRGLIEECRKQKACPPGK